MNTKKRLFASALVIALAAAGVLISGSHNVAKGSGAAPVSIMSPLPLPITGTATVSGTVGATQSGAWSVGISGTPTVGLATGSSVNVSNFPATQNVSLASGGSLTIANTASAPVPVENAVAGPLTHLGRLPSDSIILNLEAGTHSTYDLIGNDGTVQSGFSIPTGDVLVVTDVDWDLGPGTSGNTARLFLSFSSGARVFTDGAVTGSNFEAAKHNALTSGIVLTQLPTAISDPAVPPAVLHLVLRGYLMPSS